MNDYGDVKLAFAVSGGSLPLIHISNFSHLRGYEKRPTADLTCWECGGPVIPVVGEVKAHHFRHKPETTCTIGTGGESTLHFNAKASLVQEMNKFHKASLVYECSRCRNWYSFLQIGPYDRVEPERKISTRKPDVSCWMGSTTVGAAEIFHRHAVDAEKKADLNALGMPWFEIPAINVHRQFFKFVEAADIFSIDARGAGITYPNIPSTCPVCESELARRRLIQDEELERWRADRKRREDAWRKIREATEEQLRRDEEKEWEQRRKLMAGQDDTQEARKPSQSSLFDEWSLIK